LRVLVVDDDLDALDLVAMILQEQGATVTVAASAEAGLRALVTRPIDVLVADIDMPGQDGYDLMRRAKDHLAREGRGFPALALTARASTGDVQATARAGFQVHLAKPVLADDLVQAVLRLGGHGAAPHAS
jgi:CheY-like chemotaxis protein